MIAKVIRHIGFKTRASRLERAVAYCRRKTRLAYSRRRRQLFWSGTFSPDTDFYTRAAKKLGKNGLSQIEKAFETAAADEQEMLLVMAQRLYKLRGQTEPIDFLMKCAKDETLTETVRKQAVSMLACSSASISVYDIRALYEERPLRGILPALLYSKGEERHTFAMEIAKGPPSKFDREYAVLSLDPSRLSPEDIVALTKLYDQAKGSAMRGALLEQLRQTSGRDLGAFFTAAYGREKLPENKLSALTGIYRFAGEDVLADSIRGFAELTADSAEDGNKNKKKKQKKDKDSEESAEADRQARYGEIRELLDWLNGLSGEEMYSGMAYAAKYFKRPEPKKSLLKRGNRKGEKAV